MFGNTYIYQVSGSDNKRVSQELPGLKCRFQVMNFGKMGLLKKLGCILKPPWK